MGKQNKNHSYMTVRTLQVSKFRTKVVFTRYKKNVMKLEIPIVCGLMPALDYAANSSKHTHVNRILYISVIGNM